MQGKQPLSRGTSIHKSGSQPATPKAGVAGLKRESVAIFTRVLEQWREIGKLDLAALRGLVEDFVITVPADPRSICQDLRVSGRYAMAHGINMLGYALMVGKAFGIGGPDLRELGLAALLHDIGKDDEVPRNHPSRHELIRHNEHCMTGYRLLREFAPDVPASVAEAVRDHHERLDRSGPLKKDKTSELAFVLGICDLYDARVTPHWYRGSYSPHEAYRGVVQQFHRFPREIVDAFTAAVVPYPPGSEVFLMDGRTGEVVETNDENSTAPIVLVDGRRENLQDSRCRVVDLVRDGAPV